MESYWKPKRYYQCVRKTESSLSGIWIETQEQSDWLIMEWDLIYVDSKRDEGLTGKAIAYSPHWTSFIVQQPYECLLTLVKWNGVFHVSHKTEYRIVEQTIPHFKDDVLFVECIVIFHPQLSNHGTFLLRNQKMDTVYEISLIHKTVKLVYCFSNVILEIGGYNETYMMKLDQSSVLVWSGNITHSIGKLHGYALEDDLVVTRYNNTVTWYNKEGNVVKDFTKEVQNIFLKDRFTYIVFNYHIEIWTHEPELKLYAHVPFGITSAIVSVQLHSNGFIVLTPDKEFFYE